jgi:hypothetical protein
VNERTGESEYGDEMRDGDDSFAITKSDSMFDVASRHTLKSKGGMTHRSKASFVTTRTKKSRAVSKRSKNSILGESLHPIDNGEESSYGQEEQSSYKSMVQVDDLF